MFPPPSRSTAVFHTNFVWLLNTCVCVCVPGINERAVQVGNFVRIFRDFWISRWAVHDLSLIIGYSDDGLWDDDDVVFYYLGIYALLGVVIIVFTGTRTIIIQVWPSDPLTSARASSPTQSYQPTYKVCMCVFDHTHLFASRGGWKNFADCT